MRDEWMDDFRAFFHTVGAAPNAGATAVELDAFEARMGLSLPAQLRTFYMSTNGLTIDGNGSRYVSVRPAAWMEILPLAKVVPYVEGMRQYGIPQVWGSSRSPIATTPIPTVSAATGRCGTASSTFSTTTSPS